MSDYSEAAVEAGTEVLRARTDVPARAVLDAASDPALGLDRSVCLRDVVTAMRREADIYSGEIGVACSVYRIGADFIEARFTEQPDA